MLFLIYDKKKAPSTKHSRFWVLDSVGARFSDWHNFAALRAEVSPKPSGQTVIGRGQKRFAARSAQKLSLSLTSLSQLSAAQRKSGRQTHWGAGRRADLRETASFLHSRRFYARHYKMHAGVSPSSSSRAKRSRAGNCIENWNSRRYLRPVFIRLISRSRSPHLCRAQYFCWQLPNNYQLNGGSGERKWIIGLAVGNWKQIGYSARRVRSWGKWENWIVCERE